MGALRDRDRVGLGPGLPADHRQQRVGDLRVEVRPAQPRDLGDARSTRPRVLVRALVGERVEDVADGRDPALERDLLAGQAVRGSRCRPSARGGCRRSTSAIWSSGECEPSSRSRALARRACA